MDQLVLLTKFSCANNKIRKLHPRMAVWTELEELYLSHNEITDIPKSFGSFRKLKELQLGWNEGLETLPEGMANNRTLSQVDVRECSGDFNLHKSFAALPHCRWQGWGAKKGKKKKK